MQLGKTPRQQMLEDMANKFPAANQQVAKGQQMARQIQMQNQLAAPQVAQAGLGVRQLQGLAGQQATQAGQIATQQAQQTQADQVLVGQAQLQEQGRQQREVLASQQQGQFNKQLQDEARLNKLGTELRKTLFDRQMQFKKDELGNAVLTERQIQDWAISKARSQEELNDYQQRMEQNIKKETQIMEQAHNKLQAHLEFEFKKAERLKDNALMLEIQQMKKAADDAMRRQQEKAGKMAQGFITAGTIVGGVVGAVYGGGPAGAAVGASAGGAAGGMIAGTID